MWLEKDYNVLNKSSAQLYKETQLFKNVLETAGIQWKRRLCIFVRTENIIKTEPFEIDNVTIITWLRCPSFPQTQTKMTGYCCVFNWFSGQSRTLSLWECLAIFSQEWSSFSPSCRHAGYSNLWAEFIHEPCLIRASVKRQKPAGWANSAKPLNKYMNLRHEKPCFLVSFSVRLRRLV